MHYTAHVHIVITVALTVSHNNSSTCDKSNSVEFLIDTKVKP